MWQFAVKVALTAAVIVAISEVARRSSFWAALLASLPLTSLLAFVWIYLETGNAHNIAALSQGIFWLVLASLPLFLVLPLLIRMGWAFWPSLGLACGLTTVAYFALVWMLAHLGIKI
jgi:hypothetical protein